MKNFFDAGLKWILDRYHVLTNIEIPLYVNGFLIIKVVESENGMVTIYM